jgi:hypothetical protein
LCQCVKISYIEKSKNLCDFGKKKKIVIVVSIISALLLLIGVFFLGRISAKDKSLEPKNNLSGNSQQIQRLKSELNSVKSELNQSNINQKNQLESKLSSIENKVKILANQDKSTFQELEKEIKNIKEKIRNDKPGNNSPPPTDKNQLQFTVYYFSKVEQNHMWVATDTDNHKVVLVDKENPIFPNQELTQKGHEYTITFLPEDAEKFHNQSHVYYFSKNSNKFTFKLHNPEPVPGNKKEEILNYKYSLIGENVGYYVFDNSFMPSRNRKIFYISQNHPQIEKLLSQGKLQENKQFVIRYGKIDKESSSKSVLTFNENNQELEIVEA